MKNATTRRAHAVKKLQADIRIAATGTPVENRLLDLWSIFDFLNPGFLGSEQYFEKTFCKNEQPLPILKKMVSPLILRRQKEDVLLDLPPKTEITLALNLPEDARTGYELLRREALEKLQGEERSKIAVLAQLTKLRRFCCDPSLIWPARDTGIKRQRILELAQELKSAGHRALIFSQYVDFLQLILQDLTAADFACRYFDGSTPLPLRQKEVDEFQNGSGDFFLISLKAGGTGLNLTTADYVILADPWWNPAVEDQASGRAHRIGQISAVTIYRLILTGTVEEKIMELHARKRSAATDILSNSRNSTISAEQLLELFN